MPGVAGHYAPGAGSGPGISNKPGDSTHPHRRVWGLLRACGKMELRGVINIGGWGHEGNLDGVDGEVDTMDGTWLRKDGYEGQMGWEML
ncbi:hypothetical protein Pcinc_043662 [Petrolisthes cinctipes]|uniref:Uncharacterized protein n=1 Tax=Petrolisthes cinctipes TaxID=88211 RepID=A0AAE1BF70_PETCI|nr:hypothetical protein Pcinc_043662 [Petrolisthes cinctipes]